MGGEGDGGDAILCVVGRDTIDIDKGSYTNVGAINEGRPYPARGMTISSKEGEGTCSGSPEEADSASNERYS